MTIYLKQTYQIAILANERFFPDEFFIHTFEYYDLMHRVAFNGKSRIITVELSKVDIVVEKSVEVMDNKENWAVYFQYLTDKSRRRKINQILEREEGIAMASEVLMTISKDEIERARLLSEYKYQVDTQSKVVHARRQGKKEAHEEVARKALAKGIPPELIQDITGLDMDAIRGLTPENN